MERAYRPYIDPDFESFIERIHPPRVTIDNDTHKNRTLVKVDSANKHGILLEMVQVLTDLDLVISKSYISSDGDWFMDVFHVTDRHGNKITDESLILYIQQAICASRRGVSKEMHSRLKRVVRPRHVSNEHTALEISVVNRPGLLSEVAAVITELECIVTAAVAWTHGSRAACIIHIEDGSMGRPITDSKRLAKIHEQLEHVVEAHHYAGEKRSVRLTAPAAGRTHTEQRLHQLMYADGDYGTSSGCSDNSAAHVSHCTKIHVSIESCREKGYSIVSTMSRDRPKLLFDTICALTDLQFVVFHAAVCSKGAIAYQEYFIRRTDGRTLDTESQSQKLTLCLIAAIERRVSHGLRLDICTENRTGLLSNLTRKFRESGVSISRAEIGTDGDKAIGSFYVTDPSGNDVNPKIIDSIQKEIGGSVIAVNRTPLWTAKSSKDPLKTSSIRAPTSNTDEDKSWFSLGGLFRSQLDRLSSNFGFIRS